MLRLHTPPTPDTDALLTRAMFPDPARLQATLRRYRTDPDWQLHTWEVSGMAVSAAGLTVSGHAGTVQHLGTHPDHARQGHARALLHSLMTALNLDTLSADTDEDAADFYRRSGFRIQELPSQWERRRYRCTRMRQQENRPRAKVGFVAIPPFHYY
ncbi:GNAT family N-acetyltransferase [Deinococcus sp. 14RED07]|uniref:GNAT family N-acetyltransferase n=1 Tax=Deinococcus sp. 14RED07 TaxID=2745874 RepID=UPI001E4C287B|nr:GNAT family N-acetyltransferase [Deinococcus sp. 14RED07]MCD0176381.1 GNAT family N-acetyltransferase [Deinococcus sp. 14RED07]